MFGLFVMFENPVSTWYPLNTPTEFDCAASLMYDGQLSEEANRFLFQELLEEGQLSLSANGVLQQIALENHDFKKLIEQLQSAASENPEEAQKEYVRLRAFLINYPYASTEQLRSHFSNTRYISPHHVGNLYEACLHGKSYWNCNECGPLIEKNGLLRGIKPTICNDHRLGLPHVQRIEWSRGLRRIKPGLHWRVCLPGISEMKIFSKVEKLQKQYSDYLCDFTLWPGIDRYDLRLCFSDQAVWAVDVKDYHDPYNLAKHLRSIYGEGTLQYDEGFYVIPMRQIWKQDNYLQIARNQLGNLPHNISLLSEEAFEAHIAAKIATLQKNEA